MSLHQFFDVAGIEIQVEEEVDLDVLMAQEYLASEALKKLAFGQFDIDTTLDVLEYCGVNMDDYLFNLEQKVEF